MLRPYILFAATAIGLFAVALVGLSGCGDDAPDGQRETAFAGRAASPACDVGGVAPLKVQRVRPSIIEMQSPPLILACGKSSLSDRFYIVGFDTDKGICVSVDSMRQGESYGIICKIPGRSWFDFCQDQRGCILRSEYLHGFTEIAGVLTRKAKGIRAAVRGDDEIAGLTMGGVADGLLRRLDSREPFNFFALFLPGCVPVEDLRLQMLNARGSPLGPVRETGGPPSPCGKARP